MTAAGMAGYRAGDTVVYPPHGPGVVVESPETDGPPILTIRIANSTLTLSVPEADAQARGVRPAMSAEESERLLSSMATGSEALLDTAQLRRRAAAEVERSGDASRLAATIRDYDARRRSGGKLTPSERTIFETARRMLASEIALVRSIPVDDAAALLDRSLAD